MEQKKVTAGRDILGDLAPKFAELNDDVLFGEVWSREEQLSARDRSLITVAALMGSGILDSSLKHHLVKAKENGITKDEMVEVITHVAFYAGGPKVGRRFAWPKKCLASEPIQPILKREEVSQCRKGNLERAVWSLCAWIGLYEHELRVRPARRQTGDDRLDPGSRPTGCRACSIRLRSMAHSPTRNWWVRPWHPTEIRW